MNVPGLPYLNDQIDETLSRMDSLMIVAGEFMKDTSISLEDRWTVYLKIEKLLPIRSYLGKAIDVLTDIVYEDFFSNGRGCLWNSDIDERIVEDREVWRQNEPKDDYGRESRVQSEKLYAKRDEWREAVLQEQQGLIVFDW